MDEYFLDSKELYEILKAKGIKNLFHANTVLTSLTFIQNGALLSRGFVESKGLLQTEQKSDAEDKYYDVWDDVFLDGLDLHDKYRRPNKYGPIVFALKLELLLSPSFSKVLITKTNPWYWKSTKDISERYYSNIEEIKKDYLTGVKLDSRIMFTFRGVGNSLKISDFVEFIGVDKPTILINLQGGGEKNVGDYAYDAIMKTLKEEGFTDIELRYRHPKGFFNFCRCNFIYTFLFNNEHQEFRKRFQAKL